MEIKIDAKASLFLQILFLWVSNTELQKKGSNNKYIIILKETCHSNYKIIIQMLRIQ